MKAESEDKMNWQHFQTYNDAPTRAFESMCNQLFELWCKKSYQDAIKTVTIVNGSGGDGGVEAFAINKDGTIIGLQAKWFLNSISRNQFSQINDSIESALRVRPMIKQYIVCIPRDLAADRIGKGKKVIEDTELSRWQELKNKLEDKYSGLTIDLWNETKLLNILQDGDAAGIYRFWFEKSEISKELIAFSYEKQKSGWLSQKYTPSLHIQGKMQKSILKFLGTLDDRKNSVEALLVLKQHCIEFLKACDGYLPFVLGQPLQEELISEITDAEKLVSEFLCELELSIEAITEEQNTSCFLNKDLWYINFGRLLELLKQNDIGNKRYFHINEIKKFAEAIQEAEIHAIRSDIRFRLNNNKILILGDPGSGKTHGVANLTELLISGNFHIPILIRAKDINPQNNWLDIIKQSLGLSGVWNEIELWQALEALSYRQETHNISSADAGTVKIIPKILVCIEGVDESRPYDVWYDRLREIDAICSKYPRLRFCITSRPYVFRKLPHGDSLLKNTIYLPSDGDVPVSELFPEYIQYFNVNVGGCSWIKWSLKTPLALRIFCELYKDKKIVGVEKSSITITNLLSQKFHIIEKEFNSKYETGYGDKDRIVQNSLLSMARVFLTDSSALRTDLINSLKDVPGLITGARDYRRELIDFIEDYGILQSYTVNSDTIFESSKTHYSIGIQPFFDYILALLITHEIHELSEITLTEALSEQEGALQMLSILLLEDHDYLIIRNRSFRNSLNSDELFDLVCFALSNVSPNAASKYLSLVQKVMKYSSDTLRNIVIKIILPSARIENHPLGAQLLHEYLMGFETAGKRDIMWSVPSYLSYQGDVLWSCHTKIDLTDKRYELYSEDKYNGIPLVFAWMLTTMNNVERVGYRRQLMKWASVQPLEFYKLFEYTCNTNDPQMLEDLFAIAMGTVFMLKKENPCIHLFCNWMLENVFAPDKIVNRNTVLSDIMGEPLLNAPMR